MILNYETLSTIADRILGNDEIDHVEAYRVLHPALHLREAAMLAGMLELCPRHKRDEAICKDERPQECAHLYPNP